MRPTDIAHRLLDAAQAGAPIEQIDIEDALTATGDIPTVSGREREAQSTLQSRMQFQEEIERCKCK